MVRQGGKSYSGVKKGVQNQGGKCLFCGRFYKMGWTKERHERQCKEYNEVSV